MKNDRAALADGEKPERGLFEAIEVRWKDRAEITRPWSIQSECSVLPGSLPVEGMDIMIDVKMQRLAGARGGGQRRNVLNEMVEGNRSAARGKGGAFGNAPPMTFTI